MKTYNQRAFLLFISITLNFRRPASHVGRLNFCFLNLNACFIWMGYFRKKIHGVKKICQIFSFQTTAIDTSLVKENFSAIWSVKLLQPKCSPTLDLNGNKNKWSLAVEVLFHFKQNQRCLFLINTHFYSKIILELWTGSY